ncbi:hypothetical protein M427DRAFT_40714 [Gonapodya prolifera JEL478]|uniref:Uncharacterized protein n=1 Tax=Gonapodya prolifera (strain JEL478) TaxID=1344416 RepID=A0A139AZ11_GONPJ|nr:hypothetical protein M427DRAFT_40714 [Gonapodya prolifera JEL478]|eukprot:KXS21959.1 hypothetical protein M427DRAFT_40714 [Gonapodya prolifera JEL478]
MIADSQQDGGDGAVAVAKARTRFVVPFPYWLQSTEQIESSQIGLHHDEWIWTEGTPAYPSTRDLGQEDAANRRRNYFVPEISIVCQDRARTFVLRRSTSQECPELPPLKLSWSPGGPGSDVVRTLDMVVVAAYMVLFEFPSSDVHHHVPGPLHHGFMVMDLTFPNDVQVVAASGGLSTVSSRDSLNLADVLQVNELFKYYRLPFPGHPNFGYADLLQSCRYDWRKPELIGKPSSDEDKAGSKPPKSDGAFINRAYLGRWDWMLECPLRHPHTRQLLSLMPKTWIVKTRDSEASLVVPKPQGQRTENSSTRQRSEGPERSSGWLSYPDNRAFVWTAVMADSSHLTTTSDGSRIDSGQWVRFVNVDLPTLQSPGNPSKFERSWIDPLTYRRWSHYGSQYGFTYHSGAFWTTPNSDSFFDIFFGVYFDMALVLFYSRVSLLHFSWDVALLAPPPGATEAGRESSPFNSRAHGTPPSLVLLNDLQTFTRMYLQPSFSIQQQGHELSAVFRSAMEVDTLYEHLAKRLERLVTFEREIDRCPRMEGGLRRSDWMGSGAAITISAAVGLFAVGVFMLKA